MRRALLATSVVLASSFACATREDPTAEAPPPPPEPTPVLDAESSDAPPDALPPSPSGCSKGGFCYVPVPGQKALLAVAASSADDAWMVPQEGGTILRWDGTSLKEVYVYEGASPSSITFTGIWTQRKDDVWAAAKSSDNRIFLVRYASPLGGGAPTFRELRTQEPPNATVALWATPAGDALWLATDRSILRVHEEPGGAVVDVFNPVVGAEGTTQYSWRGVWGYGPDDVYVAGTASDTVCSGFFCQQLNNRGVIGHYDGTAWSITTLESSTGILSLRGTPPGTERRLWYTSNETVPSTAAVLTSLLVPVTGAGLGPALFSHVMNAGPACSSRVGHAVSPSAGWFSEGLLLCRWTGTMFEPAQTGLAGRPVVHSLNGIWANDADDVWIVGASVTRPDLPQGAFAARRTAATAKGESQ